MTDSNKSSREGTTSSAIVAGVRQRIIGGEYPPGTRLPNRIDLLSEYQTTHATMQKAFDRLKRDGFVVARGRAGTFISDSPPHLCHYAVVSTEPAPGTRYPQFWLAMERAAQAWSERTKPRRVTFTVVHAPTDAASTRRFERIVRLADSDRVAGILFTSNPYRFSGTALLEKPGVPRIAVMGRPHKGVACMFLSGFFQMAIAYLKQQGRKRVAAIMPTSTTTDADAYQATLRKAGFDVKPWWIQAIPGLQIEHQPYIRNLVQLFRQLPEAERPDSMIIGDDHVVEPATEALKSLGVRVPQQMTVVGHANFPLVTPANVPTWRIGYDVRDILAAAIRWIDACRAGLDVQPIVNISAMDQASVPPWTKLGSGSE